MHRRANYRCNGGDINGTLRNYYRGCIWAIHLFRISQLKIRPHRHKNQHDDQNFKIDEYNIKTHIGQTYYNQ